MDLQICLKVFMADSQKPVFERIIHQGSQESYYFDYSGVVASMFNLFGKSCRINFEIVQ